MALIAEQVIAQKYILGPMIGKGSFGQVYLARVEGQDNLYAVKKQWQRSKHPQLFIESRIIKMFDGLQGFPKIHYVGNQNKATFMVMDMLGPSIEDMFFLCQKKFDIKTVLMLADQMIARIQKLHGLDYLHRDIKPENFLIGIQEKSHLMYLVDFGLCKRFKDSKTHQHIPYRENKHMTGTVRYASINAHFGVELSRRDDLESIGYVLIYLATGNLPWQGIQANNKLEKYERIQEKKLSVPIEIMCKGLPIEFSTYMHYCRRLKFEEKPDYKFLRRSFKELADKIGIKYDNSYIWTKFQEKKNYEGANIKIKFEKKDDPINAQFFDKQRQRKNSYNHNLNLKEEQVQIKMLSSCNGSENVPEDSNLDFDLDILKEQKNDKQNVFEKYDKRVCEDLI